MSGRQDTVGEIATNPRQKQTNDECLSREPTPWDIVPESVEVVARWYAVVVTANGRRIPVAKIPND